MLVEMWKDPNGYRLKFEEQEFDLSTIAYAKLVDSLGAFEQEEVADDEEGTYESLELDLEDK